MSRTSVLLLWNMKKFAVDHLRHCLDIKSSPLQMKMECLQLIKGTPARVIQRLYCKSHESVSPLQNAQNTVKPGSSVSVAGQETVKPVASASKPSLAVDGQVIVNTSPDVCTTSSASVISPAQFYRRPLPKCCISFSSRDGKAVFGESLASGHMEIYFPLASQFRTQDEPAFCGLSTLVMALNALEIDPQRIWKAPWRFYHENMLDCCIPLEKVQRDGITMDQFACLAACNTLHVRMVRTDNTAVESDFRSIVLNATRKTDQIVVASYSRAALDQTGDGHFSPIGGYHPGRDLVLIMDTARFKYPPHWVSLSRMFKAMQEIDSASGLPRGYFVLTKSRVKPALLFRPSSHLSPIALEKSNCGMLQFLQNWQYWLLEPARHATGLTAVAAAVEHLLSLLKLLPDNTFVLTTRAAMATECNEDDFQEQADTDSMKNLVDIIQQLELFDLVENLLSSSKSPANKKFGRALGLTLQGMHKCSDGVAILSSMPDQLKEDSSTAGTSSNVAVPENIPVKLTETHFVVMLLLSWPYHRCSRDTFGLALQKYMLTQLTSVSSNDHYKILHNETSQLKQQLNTIVNFAGNLSKTRHCH